MYFRAKKITRSFFSFKIHLGIKCDISLLCLFILFFSVWNSYSVFLGSWSWHFWTVQSSYFVEFPSIWFYSCLSNIRFGFCIFGRDVTEVMLCSSQGILSRTQCWFVPFPVRLIFIIALRWYLSKFFSINLQFSLCN